jgi:hypothetical protein
MISSSAIGVKLGRKASTLCGLYFIFAFYQLTRLSSYAHHADIEEDTIVTGGTASFVTKADVVTLQKTIRNSLQIYGFPVYELSEIVYTRVHATRGEAREALVYAFIGSSSSGGVETFTSADVGLTIAKSVIRKPWLAKDIFFVFFPSTPSTSYHMVGKWLDEFLKCSYCHRNPVPLIRGACVVDISGGHPSGIPEVVVEGMNGNSAIEDFSNVMFEAATELGYPISVKSAYDSISFGAGEEAVTRGHNAFLDFGIPSFTFQRSRIRSFPRSSAGVSLHSTAEVVGKHLRAVSGMNHQLHHSTPHFIYGGIQEDISLGVYLPLFLGLIAPLAVSVLNVDALVRPNWLNISLLGLGLSIPLCVGLGTWVMRSSPLTSELPLNSAQYIISLLHIVASYIIKGAFTRNLPEGTNVLTYFLTSIERTYALLSASLMFLDWRLATSLVLFIVPVLQTLNWISSPKKRDIRIIAGPVLLAFVISIAADRNLKIRPHFPDLRGLDDVAKIVRSFADEIIKTLLETRSMNTWSITSPAIHALILSLPVVVAESLIFR